MKYIKTYKIFEGVYLDTLNKIDALNDQILEISEEYVKEVSDCFTELTDKYKYKKDEGGSSPSEYMGVVYDFEVKISEYFDFLDDFEDVYYKLRDHIGKLPYIYIYYHSSAGELRVFDIRLHTHSKIRRNYFYSKLDYKELRQEIDNTTQELFTAIKIWNIENDNFYDPSDVSDKPEMIKLTIKFVLPE